MKTIFEIARVSFQELIREKFVFASFLVAIFLLVLSLALGDLTNYEKQRVLIHFGFLSIELTLVALGFLLGSSAIPKEIEKQTCLLILVRPLTRRQFIIGKWLGLVFLLATAWLILNVFLLALLSFDVPYSTFLVASLGIFFEAITILSASLLASFIFRPAVAVFMGISVFLVGNSLDQLQFLSRRATDAGFNAFVEILSYTFPQLYRVNWRSHHFVMKAELPADLFPSLMHILGWILVYLALSSLLFRRKDLV